MGHQKHARKFPRNQAAVAPGEVADRGDLEPGPRAGLAALVAARQAVPAAELGEDVPNEIRDIAERLRSVVHESVPEAIERVRTGWRLIGYDVPVGRRTRYFTFVAPEPKHVHLGFEYGAWMTDPDDLLQGAHLNLRKVRFVTYEPGNSIPTEALVRYTREAAALAAMRPSGRPEPG